MDSNIRSSSSSFKCPYCGVFAQQTKATLKLAYQDAYGNIEVLPLTDEPHMYRANGDGIQPNSIGVDWQVYHEDALWWGSLCAACECFAIWRGDALLYPRVSAGVSPAHVDMPDKPRALYEEAAAVLPVSRRAAAALARASLEALLKEVAPSGSKNLQSRIGDLQGEVNPKLWKVITALRIVGNDSLHGDEDALITFYLEGEVSEIVEPFFGAINALVEELITQPRQADALYELIPEPKREAAERAGATNRN